MRNVWIKSPESWEGRRTLLSSSPSPPSLNWTYFEHLLPTDSCLPIYHLAGMKVENQASARKHMECKSSQINFFFEYSVKNKSLCESGERHRCASVRLKSNVAFCSQLCWLELSNICSHWLGGGFWILLFSFPAEAEKRSFSISVLSRFISTHQQLVFFCPAAVTESATKQYNWPSLAIQPSLHGNLIWEISAKTVCRKSLRENLMGKFSQNLLWENLA